MKIYICILTTYRELNQITMKNKYSLPRIDGLFYLQGSQIFSKTRLVVGLLSATIKAEDIPKMAF